MKQNKTYRLFHFFIDCLIHLEKHNVRVVLTRNKSVNIKDEGVDVSGYWDDANPKKLLLACIVQKDDFEWLEIFIHEYAHFLQFLDKNKIWKKVQKINPSDMNKIVHNKSINSKKVEKILNAMRDIEIDCEKRVVKLIRKYKLPIDVKKYMKQANCFIHFYNHLKVYREWYKGDEPDYVEEEIKKVCSSKFYKNYDFIPSKLQKKFDKFYPPKIARKEIKYAKRKRR